MGMGHARHREPTEKSVVPIALPKKTKVQEEVKKKKKEEEMKKKETVKEEKKKRTRKTTTKRTHSEYVSMHACIMMYLGPCTDWQAY